jgi:hypothetical protein
LQEANVTQIVERGGLHLFVVAGDGKLERSLGFTQFVGAELLGALVVEIAWGLGRGVHGQEGKREGKRKKAEGKRTEEMPDAGCRMPGVEAGCSARFG